MGKQYSAPGGQLDFVRGAQRSKGGKSILAAYSTAATAPSPASCQRSKDLPPIQEPIPSMLLPNMASLVSPENRRRKEPRRLIEIAHPKFRDELRFGARQLGYL